MRRSPPRFRGSPAPWKEKAAAKPETVDRETVRKKAIYRPYRIGWSAVENSVVAIYVYIDVTAKFDVIEMEMSRKIEGKMF